MTLMITGLLTISEDEWKAAEEFFRENSNASSKDLGPPPRNYSFIRIPTKPGEFQIFAMAKSEVIREPAKYPKRVEDLFCEFKVVQNKAGENFAVKIEERRGLRGDWSDETKITKLLGFTIGEAEIPEGTTKKLYTVMQLRQGEGLEKYIYLNPKSKKEPIRRLLSVEEKLNIALKICNAVKALHSKKIIHANLNPESFMADIKQDQVLITPNSIGFGFSKLLKQEENTRNAPSIGSHSYTAPELKSGETGMVPYSFSSDIFALGKIFEKDLQLPEEIYKNMLVDNPTDREDIDTVIQKTNQELNKVTRLNGVFEKYKEFDNIKQEYDSHRKGSAGKLMSSFAKRVSYTFSDKENVRKGQMNKIAAKFNDLYKEVTIPADNKAQVALGHLFSFLDEINRESKNFKLTSSLELTCKKLISEITEIIGAQKVKEWFPDREFDLKPKKHSKK